MRQQHHVVALASASRAILPGEVAALADPENLAQASDGELFLRRIGETESHRLPSLAKTVAALFKNLALLAKDLVLAPQTL